MEQTRNGVIHDAIASTYEDARAKAQLALTPRAKIKACNDGILKLRELAKSFGDRPEIEPIVRALKKHACTLEYRSFIEAAQKAEFKGSFKKALDQYQEALYFLRTDEIDDSDQQRAIVSLESKIEELKDRIGTPKTKSAAKRIASDSE